MTDNPKLVELRFKRLIRLAIWTRRNSASTSVSTSVSTSFSSSNMTLLKRSFPASTEVGGFPTCMCTPLPWPLVCVVLRGFFRGVVALFALAALLLFLAAPAVRINVPKNSSKGWEKVQLAEMSMGQQCWSRDRINKGARAIDHPHVDAVHSNRGHKLHPARPHDFNAPLRFGHHLPGVHHRNAGYPDLCIDQGVDQGRGGIKPTY